LNVSFIQAISIAPLLVHYYSALGAPDTAWILCRSFSPKRHRQLQVNDLPKVPTCRLKRDSELRPFGRETPNLPMSHHVSLTHITYFFVMTFNIGSVSSEYLIRYLRKRYIKAQLHYIILYYVVCRAIFSTVQQLHHYTALASLHGK